MNIEVQEEREGNTLVLVPVSRLDSANARAFEGIVMDHVRAGELNIVVDFSRLVFISSSGMRVLLIAAKSIQAQKGKLALSDMHPNIREIFSISGFDQIIKIYDSRAQALAA